MAAMAEATADVVSVAVGTDSVADTWVVVDTAGDAVNARLS